uniref:Alpha-S1-casein n=1 Tax=Saimiri boliviensis boliviensis TaxID=39432 RepID=A0A2K6TD89_SAIBB
MKLLILTCLVAVALARPVSSVENLENFHSLMYCFTNIIYLLFFIPKKYINGVNRQRKVLREKQSDEIKVPKLFLKEYEQCCRLNEYNQLQLNAFPFMQGQTHRMSENNHVQVPFQQLSQFVAYPYAVWYYPQIRQNLPFPPFSDFSSPIVPENYEKTNVMLQWW